MTTRASAERFLASSALAVLVAALALPAALATSGCGRAEQKAAQTLPAPDKDAITKVTQNGPVKATVQVWPVKPVLSDPVYVKLTIDAEPDVQVELPFQTGQLGESALGRFRVLDFARVESRTDKGHYVEEHTYQLQAQSSGRSRIPPFRLEMIDRRGGASGTATGAGSASAPEPRPAEVLTEEVPLEVAEIPVEKITASMAGARGPLVLNPGQLAWWWWLAFALVGVLWVALAVMLWKRWKQRQAIARRRSAYDEAVSELRKLESAGAPDVDTADAWFVRLSAIVRRYLESRYEIRAPELTTEEFLQVAVRGASLSAAHRALLASFLECCDRVKFAAYRPEQQESLDMLAAARSFVEDTRLREPGELGKPSAGGTHAA